VSQVSLLSYPRSDNCLILPAGGSSLLPFFTITKRNWTSNCLGGVL